MTDPDSARARFPFLLNLVTIGNETSKLKAIYSEVEELNFLVGENVPVASTQFLLSTQSKTLEHKETDDPDR